MSELAGLLERLRYAADRLGNGGDRLENARIDRYASALLRDAADEIERLRKELAVERAESAALRRDAMCEEAPE